MPSPSLVSPVLRRYFAVAIALLLLAAAARSGYAVYQNQQLRSQFSLSSSAGSYQQKTAMEEMDWSVYDRLLPDTFSLPDYSLTPVLNTPVALRYYTEIPGKDTAPALEIPLNSPIAALPPHATGSPFYEAGYGYTSYPTYEKGWRYARPFALAGEEDKADQQPYYYVSQKNLHAVARKVIDAHQPLAAAAKQRGLTSPQAAHSMTLYLDDLLYQGGVYISPDLDYPLVDRLNAGLLIIAGILLIAMFLPSSVKSKPKKPASSH